MAKFRLFKDSKGEYRFTLIADNGEAVAQSEGYKTKQGAENGINVVKRIAATAYVDDQTATQNSLLTSYGPALGLGRYR